MHSFLNRHKFYIYKILFSQQYSIHFIHIVPKLNIIKQSILKLLSIKKKINEFNIELCVIYFIYLKKYNLHFSYT